MIRARSLPWLNRNVAAMGVTSLLSDASHEAVTSVLPGFLAGLGLPPVALGVIEGLSDALSSFTKLGAGWLGDRTGHRQGTAVAGYILTGLMPLLVAVASSWPLVLVAKTIGWLGRGIRGPLRDAILAESVPPEARGRAFGFHRAGDTVGAVIGPLAAVVILGLAGGTVAAEVDAFRLVFWVALVPGLAAALTFGLFVHDPAPGARTSRGFVGTLRALPGAFRRFLVAVGLFGLGDYAPGLLILATTTLLSARYGLVGAGAIAGLLYVLRNVVYAAGSFPAGLASDRTGRAVTLLAGGYGIGALVALGATVAFVAGIDEPAWFALLFVAHGTLAAIQDTLEGVATADLAGPEARATSYGMLGTVNGVGDLVASAGVGALWTIVAPGLAFGAAAALMGLGALVLFTVDRRSRS